MWIAALIGFVVGAWFGGMFSFGVLTGGALGALAGLALASLRRRAPPDAKPLASEQRIAALEAEMRRVRTELSLVRAELAGRDGVARQAVESGAADSEESADGLPADATPEEVPASRAEAMLRGVLERAVGTPEPAPGWPESAGPARSTLRERAPEPLPAPTPAGAAEHAGEDAFERLYGLARGWLFGGNTVVRVGLLVLFFGFAFLARYAVEHALLPIELRLAAVAAGGIALLVTGWRLRAKRTAYAMSMQGGGVAVLYLTVFAALRLYQLLPPAFAFVLLLVMVVLAAVLAVLQNAPALAVIGTAGGFMAPILASTGQGDHVALFTYYTVLNLGVLGIAWKKAWRILNLTGFLFTFSIALAWGARDYRPEHFASTEPFLIGFFLLYVAAAVLYAWRQAPELKHTVDGGLVFGTPVVAFGLQAALCQHIEYAMAGSALAVGGFYVLLARWLLSRGRDSLRLLVEAFLALGVAFLTLAIPLALDGRWTAAAWALEGAALLWVGARQSRKLAIAAGLLLQLGAGIFFGTADGFGGLADYRSMPVANAQLVGALMIALAGFFAARIATVHRAGWPRALEAAGPLLLGWATLWWLGGTLSELDAWLPRADMPAALLATVAASAVLAAWLARRIDWDGLHAVSLIVAPGMLLSLLGSVQEGASPAAGWGPVGWALAVAAHAWVLRLAEHLNLLRVALGYVHIAGLWLVTGALAWMLGDAVDRRLAANSWHLAAGLLAPMAAVQAVLWAKARERWPVERWPDAYLAVAAGGLVGVLLAAVFFLNLGSNGLARPLPFIPLLNPLELALAAALLTALRWRQAVQLAAGAAAEDSLLRQANALAGGRGFVALLAGLVFLFANGVLLRTLHHATGVRWDAGALFASDTVQMAVSLFWALLGLVLTYLASRNGRRVLWIAGATLLGLVVAKLFLVDMASTGTVARIVSFLGAGVLLVIVGYLSPLPPAREDKS